MKYWVSPSRTRHCDFGARSQLRRLCLSLNILFAALWPLTVACSGANSGAGDDQGQQGDGGGNGDRAGGSTESPAEVGAEFNCQSNKQQPAASVVRRLTAAEYINSVKDITGADLSDRRMMLPRENGENGFKNDARAQTVSLDHVTLLGELAEEAVRRMKDKPGFINRHSKCADLTGACFSAFAEKLGLRMFRRPLSDDDKAPLMPLLKFVQDEKGTYQDAAELVLLSMLQSPRFLYLIESERGEGKVRQLDDYEMAARLSYLFTASLPDDELLAAAAAGALTKDDKLDEYVERLLGSPRARTTSLTFLNNWLNMDRLTSLDGTLGADMAAETEAVFDQVVWKDGLPMSALFKADFTYASKALATHYKFSNPQDGIARYSLGGGARKGLLTQGTVLTAGGDDGSLVQRGLFVLHNVLCSDIPPPPVGVNNARPATESGKSQRWYAEQRASTGPCSNCHKHLDPLAFPLERFSGVGLVRDNDDKGNVIDTKGILMTPYDQEGKAFDDVAALADLLADDERVRDCLILKPVQFALARSIDAADGCMLAAVRDSVQAKGPRYQDVLKSLVKQPGFRAVLTAN